MIHDIGWKWSISRIRLSFQHEDAPVHRAPVLEGAGSRRDAKFWSKKWSEHSGAEFSELDMLFSPRKDGLFGMIWMYIILLLLWYFILCHYLLISYCDIILDTILQYYVRVLYHNIILCYSINIYIYIVVFKNLSYNPVPFGQSHMHLYRLAAGKKSLPSWV